MTRNVPTYRHDLGSGHCVDVFAVDQALQAADLQAMLSPRIGKAGGDRAREGEITWVGEFDSVDALPVSILPGRYRFPEPLRAYRHALAARSNAMGRYDGRVAIVRNGVKVPLELIQGGFYDYLATLPGGVPHTMAHEFAWAVGASQILDGYHASERDSATLRQVAEQVWEYARLHDEIEAGYPEGKTVGALMEQWGIALDRAQYLGFAHVIMPRNGEDVLLVQRAKGLAVAPGCIGTPGSTPNPDFSQKGFHFPAYCRQHLVEELEEEMGLMRSEFFISGIGLVDDTREMPVCAIRIRTPVDAEEIARRIYGKKSAVLEHPVLYALPVGAVAAFIDQVPVLAPTKRILKHALPP